MKEIRYKLMAGIYLILGVIGILLSFTHAFKIVYIESVVFGTIGITALFSLLFWDMKKKQKKIFGIGILAAVWGLVFLFEQEEMIQSFRYIADQIAEGLNQNLKFQLELRQITAGNDGTRALASLFGLLTLMLAWEVVKGKQLWIFYSFLAAGFLIPFVIRKEPENMEVYLIFLSGIGLVSVKDGGNRRIGIAGAVAATAAFFIGSFFLVPQMEPVFKDRQAVREAVTGEWERAVMSKVRGDSATGGVGSGKVGNYDELEVGDVPQLRITASQRPKERIYLQGYVGAVYEDNTWKEGGNAFETWSRSENTDGVKVRNLLYDRIDKKHANLHIENIGANQDYQYMPYGAHYKEDDKIEGDTFVRGKKKKDYDVTYCQSQDFAGVLKLEEKELEKRYERFVRKQYVMVPEYTKEAFEEIVDARITAGNVEKAVFDTKSLLWEYAQYSLTPGKTPQGKDAVEYFYFENKKGYCVHFASAATLLLRIRGIPARYAAGYLIKPTDFKEDEEGNYTAVVTGKFAHAWTEVYRSGAGWMPEEVTPGYGAALLDNGSGGVTYAQTQPIVKTEDNTTDQELQKNEETEEEAPDRTTGAGMDGHVDEKEGIGENKKSGLLNMANILGVSLAAFILVVGSVFLRKSFLRLQRRKEKRKSYTVRTIQVFWKLFEMLADAKIVKWEEALDESFIKKVSDISPDITSQQIERMMDIVTRANYDNQKISAQEYQQCDKIKRILEKHLIERMPFPKRLWWKYWKGI